MVVLGSPPRTTLLNFIVSPETLSLFLAPPLLAPVILNHFLGFFRAYIGRDEIPRNNSSIWNIFINEGSLMIVALITWCTGVHVRTSLTSLLKRPLRLPNRLHERLALRICRNISCQFICNLGWPPNRLEYKVWQRPV